MHHDSFHWGYALEKLSICILSATILTGCMVGPDFHTPPPPLTTQTKLALLKKTVRIHGAKTAGQSQRFIIGQNIDAAWWYLFHSRILNSLIATGLANNPNLTAAYAALRQAQENYRAQIGNSLLPAFDAQLSGQRQLFSGASFGGGLASNIFNLFNANVSVSYVLDILGGARRQIEALRAQIDYQQFELIAAYLSLTANIVTTSVTIASLQEQILTTRALIQTEEEQLAIMRKQFTLGGLSQSDVLLQETLVFQTRASLPPLEKNLSQNRHALLALIGFYPGGSLPNIRLNALSLPSKLPVSLPSKLVRQRPDVRAAEALLHVASAQIGVATANLLPQITLSGSYGWQSIIPATLFKASTNVWSIASQLSQPIFHGGALLAQRRAAIAAYDQALAQYRQTVLQAFQNVADSLRAIETDARALKAQTAAETSAYRVLALTKKQYRLGGVSYLTLLNAQQQYQQTMINRIQAQAARYNDTAALFQALGGGWWNRTWCVQECL
jgi:NodT family efflux transporter outer membrane factor (OMF) lipoprotein